MSVFCKIYFIIYTLLFIGYSASDPNIKAILSDIDEIISPNDDLIPNIYILKWKQQISESESPKMEEVISIENKNEKENRNIRIKSITASSFDWVFKAFINNGAIENVNPKLLRALLARTYKLVRKDIPRETIEVNYDTLERAANNDKEMARLYGITTLDDPAAINAAYPYTLTQVGEELGYSNWHGANKLIEKVKKEKDFNIKDSDNKYHIAIRGASGIQARKYSDATVELLKKVKDNKNYDLNKNELDR